MRSLHRLFDRSRQLTDSVCVMVSISPGRQGQVFSVCPIGSTKCQAACSLPLCLHSYLSYIIAIFSSLLFFLACSLLSCFRHLEQARVHTVQQGQWHLFCLFISSLFFLMTFDSLCLSKTRPFFGVGCQTLMTERDQCFRMHLCVCDRERAGD